MADDGPLVLKLAPLPRNQIGPFLILGVDKDASKEVIEAAWAQRLIWARKGQFTIPLEDINWAREIITDPERKLRADAVSMNIETTEGTLRRLTARFQEASVGCQPIDVEPNLGDYQPNLPIPNIDEIRAGLQPPTVPRDIPAVQGFLREAYAGPLDPWDFSFRGGELPSLPE